MLILGTVMPIFQVYFADETLIQNVLITGQH